MGVLAIIAAVLIAYVPALRAGFIWDDDYYITHNRLVTAADGLAGIWFTDETPQYYPLVFTTFWLEHKLWGLHPAGYHVVNALLHAVNALLIWRIARRLKIPAAWFIGAVFALHPVHVESVAWITERKNVLSGLFYLLALQAYLRFDETGRWKFYGGASAAFVAALLSKSVTAMLPVTLPLILIYRHGRLPWGKLLPVLPLLVIGAAAGLHTAYLEYAKVGAEGVMFSQTLAQRVLIIAPSAYWFYALKVLWPSPLMFNYPRWDATSGDWTLYLPLVLAMLAVAIAVLGVRRFGRGPLVLLLYSAVTLFPALGLLNVYPHRFSYVADHFQYLGSLGFIALFVVIAAWVWRKLVAEGRVTLLRWPAAAVLLVLAFLTFDHSRSFADEERLWQDTVEANPDSWFAMTNLATTLGKQGRYDEAIPLLQRASEYEVARPEAYYFWGLALHDQGRFDEAIPMYRRALQERPDYLPPATGLGGVLYNEGRYDEAGDVLEAALQRWPELDAEPWHRLGLVRLEQRRFGDAERCFAKAVELEPHRAAYRSSYGRLLARGGSHGRAIEHLRLALAGNPDDEDARLFLIISAMELRLYGEAAQACAPVLRGATANPLLMERTARLLAACPDGHIRDGATAQRIVDRLKPMVGDNAPPEFLDTFAAVAAENGDFDEAIRLTEQVLARARQAGRPDLVHLCEQRVALYRAATPQRLAAPGGDAGDVHASSR